MAAMTIAQKIEEESLVTSPSEIVELRLSGSQGDTLDGLTDEFVKLESIKAKGCGLKSLAELPALTTLKYVDLANNNIASIDQLVKCANLESINLAKNEIDSFDSLKCLCGLAKLKSLSLKMNKVAKSDDYRKYVFSICPSLVYLDDLTKEMKMKPQVNGNGVNHGNDEVADEYNSDCSDDTDEEEDEEEEDVSGEGIACLQYSRDLEDDEEEYAPGEEDDEEDEIDEEDDDDDDEDFNENSGSEDEAAAAKATAAPVSKRTKKRVHTSADVDDSQVATKVERQADADEEDDDDDD